MRSTLVILTLLLSLGSYAFTQKDLQELDQHLSSKAAYDSQKRQQIASVASSSLSNAERYYRLYLEYRSYSYDTAYYYLDQLQDEAILLHDDSLRVSTDIGRAFIYLSAGLFKESSDVFASLEPDSMSHEQQIEYYTNYARLCYDMADYTQGALSQQYLAQGKQNSHRALALMQPADTVNYWSAAALLALKEQDFSSAIRYYKRTLEGSTISEHQRAIAYSSMAGAYQAISETDSAELYWIKAAISDLKSSTKEAVAMNIVAQLLSQHGDSERASRCIYSALDDAQLYNARHRQLRISSILPIIEQQQVSQLLSSRRRITWLTVALLLGIVVIIILAIWMWNRMQELTRAKKTIQDMNAKLRQINRIKEEYIGTFLCGQSDMYSRLDKYQRFVRRKAQEKRTDELMTIPSYIDASIQREQFYKDFDEMFLRIFPHFVEQFNALLRPEEQIVLKKGELLNTELRIFALIRLDITDNEQIARVLDYSVNTIYTYKTRIKSRSYLSGDAFRAAIFKIE